MHKETYTETRNFHYPKGTTPHLKEMYMHKPLVNEPQVREPVIHQEFNHDPVDFDYVGDMPQKTLEEVNNENNLLYAMMLNKMLKGHQ
jgi:hypothetical protein